MLCGFWTLVACGQPSSGALVDVVASSDEPASAPLGAAVASERDVTDADLTLVGGSPDDFAGAAVELMDFDADGQDDMLVGAPQDTWAGNRGGFHVLLGPAPSGHLSLSHADDHLLGSRAGDLAGSTLLAVGDTDGDGFDDLLVGAPGASGVEHDAGAAHLLLAGEPLTESSLSLAAATIEGTIADQRVGESIGGGGDLNADGYSDLVIACANDQTYGSYVGTVWLFFGGPAVTAQTLDAADVVLWGPEEDWSATGESLDIVGDVDGDGFDDLVVGTRGVEPSGAAQLVLGHEALEDGSLSDVAAAVYAGDEEDNRSVGYGVRGAGDVTGDGYDDFLVGDPSGNLTGANLGLDGFVALVMGADSPASAEIRDLPDRFGAETGSSFGMGTAAGTDMDGDGWPDVVVVDANAGDTFIYWSNPGESPGVRSAADVVVRGDDDDAAGRALSTSGDVNGDGRADLLIGGYLWDEGGTNAGGAWLHLGGEW